MILRPPQQKAVDMLRASLMKGFLRPVVAAPTAFGKTVLAGHLLKSCQDKAKRAIFICDRVKLVSQTIERFRSFGINFGVIQADHELTNPGAPIQIASIQTVARRAHMPEFDLAVVDECHITHKHVKQMMEAYNAVPFIGLSATPYAKGMGKHWDDLIVPTTQRELLDMGLLCPVNYYAGKTVSRKGVKQVHLPTGGTDYDQKELARRTESDKTLTGDIIKNWLAHGENAQTIAFSPSIDHSKWMAEQFNAAGIPAVHIDGYMDHDLRDSIYRSHDAGEFKILCCSRLLNTGYDAPQVKCLIDCFPTKSIISWVQRVGRIMRICEGKDYAVYLDHAGNLQHFGMFAEDIIPDALDTGDKPFSEQNQVKEKKEAKVKTCPQCHQEMVGTRCKCGYEIPRHKQITTTDESLERVISITAKKSQFYSEVMKHASETGKSPGWAAHIYKSKFKEWPDRKLHKSVGEVSQETKNYIKSRQIAYAKSIKRTGS